MKLDPGTNVERYVVEEVLGAGGTAMVYLVRHQSLGTRHALKVLTLTSQAIRDRMLREGQVQASLKHPNVVAVTDVIDIDGQPGLLMEYIVGPSLERALAKYKLTMGDAEVLFQGILAGVRAAHDTGLVHRDLKPANVLLQRTQAGFVPKVTDFGLAKLLEADPEVAHTRSGIAMGTPSYMAPEQIRDARSVDQRADVWSLGCLLYELMTRRRTFPGDEALAIYNSVTHGQFTPPRRVIRDLPKRVEQAIHGCLTVDRDARIPDCATLDAVLRGDREWPLPAELQDDVSDAPTNTESRKELVREARRLSAQSASASGPSVVGAVSTGGAIEEITAVPRMPPPIDTGGADEVETVLVSRAEIDATLLPGDAGVDDSIDGEEESGGGLWVYLAVGLGGLGLLMVLLFAFGAAVMSTLINERTGVSVAVEQPAPSSKDAAKPKPTPKPVAAPDPAPEDVAPDPSPHEEPETTPEAPVPAPEKPAPAPTSERPTERRPEPKAKPEPEPEPAPPSPTPEPGEPAPTPAPPEPSSPDGAEERSDSGRVRVKFGSSPQGADLWVGGFKRARTPASFDLDPGRYEVKMQQRGGEQRIFTVEVEQGGEASWCYDFGSAGVTIGACPMIGPGSFTP